MPKTLLQTKLFIPPLRPDLVSRPHLIERLNQGKRQGHRLSLVSAPAGFGKTTVVCEWLHALDRAEQPIASAWLSLDESDNDIIRFLTYLVTTLYLAKGDEPTSSKGALSMLQSPQPPPVEIVLTSLINEITTFSCRILLVLDDYHLLDSSSIDDALTFLLKHLPRQMHLVIVTRSDPNLPLARYRARAQLTELRAVDLRFTSSEAADFLNQANDLKLSASQIKALESRTEGWIAGLHLTAISLKGHKEVNTFIESFGGGHHFVLDYLIEDVLEQQPEDVQTFLLQTAILNRLSEPLCDAVRFGLPGEMSSSSRHNSQVTLETLERDNLFVVPLDEQRRWYRYHHLFGDVLRQRLRQMLPGQDRLLHRRASKWYEQNDFIGEAIEHALHAEDFERAAVLIEANSEELWRQGEPGKLHNWLVGLPKEMLFSRPHITIYLARHQINTGKLKEASQTLKKIEKTLAAEVESGQEKGHDQQRLITQDDRVRLQGRVAATQTLLSSYKGDIQGIIRFGSQALEMLPVEDRTWRSVTALALGNAHGFKGDMAAAYEARAEALKAIEAIGDTYFVLVANLEVAITLREQGRLQHTIEICQRQIEIASENGLSRTGAAGWLMAVWGETLAERNDLKQAVERARQGFDLAGHSGDLQMLGWSFMCLIRTLISSGDLVGAEKTFFKLDSLAQAATLPPWISSQRAAWQARLWLAQDNLASASHWLANREIDNVGHLRQLEHITFFPLLYYLIVARILIAQEQFDEAASFLQHLLKAAEAGQRTSKTIEILVLQAMISQAIGDLNRAKFALERALILAQPEGFIRIFVDEGPAMAALLRKMQTSDSVIGASIKQLLDAFGRQRDERATAFGPQASVEPLSERELEIVQLIAQGYTNREIASRLYLSLNTVKVHARNIYGKLGVKNRTQAVARARVLGIMPPD